MKIGIFETQEEKILSSPSGLYRLWGAPGFLRIGYQGDFSSGVKRPELEDDTISPSSAQFKNVCRYTSTPHTCS